MQRELESIGGFITLYDMPTKFSRERVNDGGRLLLARFANAVNAQYAVGMGASSIFGARETVVPGYTADGQQRNDAISLVGKQT